MTDQERAAPPYEPREVVRWRAEALPARRWFAEHGVSFVRHYTGSLACVPSRPTMFTGHYPTVHGVTQTDGLGKMADDTQMRWLRAGSVPTLGNWMRAAGYDTAYIGKWHITHADLLDEHGQPLLTNTADGEELPANIERYLAADVLDQYGFSGWVGPEPHGPLLANSGFRRDPLTADRAVVWLIDRYARRRTGDADALRPFLLVVSFVNPHDVVFFPAWYDGDPLGPADVPPPAVPSSPTDGEDLSSKPSAQRAYRDCYPSAYGPADVVRARYTDGADRYRQLYYRLHQEVDGPIDRVRKVITDEHEVTGGDVLIVRTADHGELLGAHGGLHQKWYNLYDEAARVPFEVVRLGSRPTSAATVDSAPTSHVDLVPTVLGQIRADVDELAQQMRADFELVGSFPGCDLAPLIDEPGSSDGNLTGRAVYMMTRDNILDGDSGASVLARRLGTADDPPPELRIQVPSGIGTCVEAVVANVAGGIDVGSPPSSEPDSGSNPAATSDPAVTLDPDTVAAGTRAASDIGGMWKLVRTSLDHERRTRPGEDDPAGHGAVGDEWELYHLASDPIEAVNRIEDSDAAPVLEELTECLAQAAATAALVGRTMGT